MLHGLPIPVAHAVSHPEQGKDTVDQGGNGAYRDQRIHIGGLVPQSLQSPAVVHPVQIHRGQSQEKLQQRRHQGILCSVIPMGLRQAHHMSHGEIHQYDQAGKGPDEPDLHFLHGILGGSGFFLLCLFTGKKGIVARILHRLDDILCNFRILGLHLHGPCQQVHIRLFHARNRPGHFFHPGRAGCAGHACNCKFQLHNIPPFVIMCRKAPKVPKIINFFIDTFPTLCYILPRIDQNASMHYFVPYYPFGYRPP